MYRRLYHRLYHCPSGPVPPGLDCGCCRKSFENDGFRGARGSLTAFRDPWPLACPVPFRSYVAGHGRSLSLATGQGPGLRPAPRLAALARRWHVVKPALFPLAIPSPRTIQGGVRGGVLRTAVALCSLCPSWTTRRKPSASPSWSKRSIETSKSYEENTPVTTTSGTSRCGGSWRGNDWRRGIALVA